MFLLLSQFPDTAPVPRSRLMAYNKKLWITNLWVFSARENWAYIFFLEISILLVKEF